MPRSWALRVRDILAAIEAIRGDLGGIDQESFARDARRVRSVAFSLIVIGESAASLDDRIVATAPEVPWQLMRGMRNRIVHEYFALDPEIVWDTATADLPALVEPLERMLESAGSEE